MAVMLRRLPALPKLTVYLVLTIVLIFLPDRHLPWAAAASLFLGLASGFKARAWIPSIFRFLPLALLPCLAWGVQALVLGSLIGWETALGDSARFLSLLLVSDVFTSLTSARQIRDFLVFWPGLATAAGLFLTYLPWLKEETAVLREAGKLRGKAGPYFRATLPARYLLNLLVRGMERSRDAAEALRLRAPGD